MVISYRGFAASREPGFSGIISYRYQRRRYENRRRYALAKKSVKLDSAELRSRTVRGCMLGHASYTQGSARVVCYRTARQVAKVA